jgi:predicted SnoaL-like aldol condensation-catalyzing enzyme
MKTEEKNKAVVMRFQKAFIEEGDERVFDEIVGPGFLFHQSAQGSSEGREAYRNFFQGALRQNMSDLTVHIYDMIAEGEMIALHKSYHGLLHNDDPDSESWHDTIEIVVMEMIRLKDGKFVECWAVMDSQDVAWQTIAEDQRVY